MLISARPRGPSMVTLAVAAVCLVSLAIAERAKQPHILFILADVRAPLSARAHAATHTLRADSSPVGIITGRCAAAVVRTMAGMTSVTTPTTRRKATTMSPIQAAPPRPARQRE
jgi:hypothetical protein